ncbi:MAG: Gfo/Idh/MocA family oxidoreductase [Myxococcales bacterium]|nr:Gfo/Idh/MocA family oxidoreductase [Myxococcales bacterium]
MASRELSSPVRIGVLGAARIAPFALMAPARQLPEAKVLAVAARDVRRARQFARKHDVQLAFGSYEALLENQHVDAVYNPLPNSLHAPWTVKALAAGKHVLLEKPFTSNADEAAEVLAASERHGRVVVEAFHWRFHPMAARMVELCQRGPYGRIEHIETSMCIPLPMPGDIRFQLGLAGGAMMDTGAYAAHMLRQLSGEEPTVKGARATLMSPGVDRAMEADVSLPSGGTGRLRCSLLSRRLLDVGVRVRFERGELRAFNPVGPQLGHRLRHRAHGQRWVSETFPRRATYTYQLEAFCARLLHGTPLPTVADDGLRNMQLIDAVYRAAGLTPRGQPTPVGSGASTEASR